MKKELAQLNNQVSQEMYGIGVKKQKVEIMGDKIVIFTEQKRIPALAILDGKYDELTLSVDAALVREFKERLKSHVEMQFGLTVRSILKDYDPETEVACIVILLDRPLM
ncbi:Na-translocating system protein MpsC family protein [Marininema halotolerans]|uniref:Na-translocating system protein MpsC family protein n=1 Tax=Marininema halotolerans TaxID=1155944 RepID=UPI001FE36E2E|nr:Na-translocating system protein MpsC family protein [Marininema halotolerans]